MNNARIFDLLCEVAELGTISTRAEWLTLFDRTQATNAPALLFTDATLLGLLRRDTSGSFIFVKPDENMLDNVDAQLLISYFKKPIVRPKGHYIPPYKNVTLSQVWQVITGSYLFNTTQQAQHLYAECQKAGGKGTHEHKAYQNYKRYNCDFVTFCATFLDKCDTGIDQYAGLLAIDYDEVTPNDRICLGSDLLKDTYFETALMYATVGGIRWVITQEKHPNPDTFKAMQNYCLKTYGYKPDDTGDVSRASYLFRDPNAYLSPKYVQ